MQTLFTEDFSTTALNSRWAVGGTGTWNSVSPKLSYTSGSIDQFVWVRDTLTPRVDTDVQILAMERRNLYTEHAVGIASSGAISMSTNGVQGNGVFITQRQSGNFVVTVNGTVVAPTTGSSFSMTNNGIISLRMRLENKILSVGWALAGVPVTDWAFTVDLTGHNIAPGNVALIGSKYHSNGPAVHFDDVLVSAAPASVPVNATAAPMTASARTVDPTVVIITPVHAAVQAESITASSELVEPNVKAQTIKTVTLSPSLDFGIASNGTMYYQTDGQIPTGTRSTPSGQRAVFLFNNLPADFSQPGLIKAELRFATPTRFSGSESALGIIVGPSESNYYDAPITGEVSLGSTAWDHVLDVTASFDRSTFAGFRGRSVSSGTDFAASEFATESRRPALTLTYEYSEASVSVPAGPMGASAQAVAAGVSIGDGHTATPMTASVELANPEVYAEADAESLAGPMTADAVMGDSGFRKDWTVTASGTGEATAELVSPAVSTERGPVVKAAPMTSQARWIKPMVNGAVIEESLTDDKYYQRVINRDALRYYFPLRNKGAVEANHANPSTGGLEYVGVVPGNDAPDNRHSVYFPSGSSLRQIETRSTDEVLARNSNGDVEVTLEFSFRTTKENTFLMGGSDLIGGLGTSRPAHNEVYLKNGRIFFGNLEAFNTDTGIKGFKNLADGQWHHVVIRSISPDNIYRNEGGGEIWVDGKFEIRRRNGIHFIGFPDYVGSRPSHYTTENVGVFAGHLPSSLNFVGDMSEMAHYGGTGGYLNAEEIPRHFYDFMGWTPVEVGPFEAFAFTPAGHQGKGNQKRALYLFWNSRVDAYNVGGDGNTNKMNFDPFGGNWSTRIETVRDYEGYKVFTKRVTGDYRDQRTDRTTLIDLEHDVDINDYDMIMFGDWPDEGSEFDSIDHIYGRPTYERLVRQLRWANDKGVGLMVTHPRLAVDLGIVDRVDHADTLRESSREGTPGLYDYGSAYKFPWNVSVSSGLEGRGPVGAYGTGEPADRRPEYLKYKAGFYGDSNKNDRFRIRATVPGLTDLPSYMIEDAVYHQEPGDWGWLGAAQKYLHRLDGLRIGDEFLFHGTDLGFNQNGISDNFNPARYGRWRGALAVPPGHVKAGTVVTTFGAKHWFGEAEVPNPFRDWATTIVLQPGDSLGGRPVGGKIFVNFTEAPSLLPEVVGIQVLPGSVDDEGNATWPTGYPVETSAQREWEYSFTRESLTAVGQGSGTQTVSYVNPHTGEVHTVRVAQAVGNSLYMTNVSQLFRTTVAPHLPIVKRGYYWLAERVKEEAGSSTHRVSAIKAEASMPSPVVVAEKDNEVKAAPMVALAQMPRVSESTVGDVDIRMLPMTAHAIFTGFNRVIKVEPMTAHAELVESFDMVYTSGEQIVLTLHGEKLVTLFIKEES